MKRKLGIKENRPLAGFLPTITITAKQLATEMANFNTNKNNLKGESSITTSMLKTKILNPIGQK
jgi:DNA-damage-inducible protein D